MKFNKLLAARMITSIQVRRGRAVNLKSTQYRLDVDIWIKKTLTVSYGDNVFKIILRDMEISTTKKVRGKEL